MTATILIDRIDGRDAVALVVDNRLEDLLIDPPESDATPQPGAICRAVTGQQIKGMGGTFVTLPGGAKGFLRETKGLAPGQTILVQVATNAEAGKAPPVTRRILFKSRYCIVTPDAPGLNIARGIREEERRAELAEIARDATGGVEEPGLILRSAAEAADDAEVVDDVRATLDLARQVLSDRGSGPELLVDAPGAVELAWRDWDPSAEVVREADAFERFDVWGRLSEIAERRFVLGGDAWMTVDPTRALVAVDVNTGGDTSPAAALKANRAAARALPRALRLLGLGGIVLVDFAPLAKKDRRELEGMLKAAFRHDAVETTLSGWTALGLFELQRKRERRPLLSDLEAIR